MGVKSVFYWTSTNVATHHQTTRQRLSEFSPEGKLDPTSAWRVKVTLLNWTDGDRGAAQNTLYRVQMTDHPQTQVTVFGENVLVTSENFEAILTKLSMFKLRYSSAIEGSEYNLGDFIVRVGSVRVRDSSSTVVVEVEYLPASSLSDCEQILREMATIVGVPENARNAQPSALIRKVKLSTQSGAAHSALTYIALFSSLSQGTSRSNVS